MIKSAINGYISSAIIYKRPFYGYGKMNGYERLNDILVNLFRDILYLEEEAMKRSGYKDLSMNDWHIIDAIGDAEPKTMSEIASELSITVGSLSISMNGLYKKGFVERKRGEKDRRRVYISLTEKGDQAFKAHRKFHRDMIEAVREDQSDSEYKALVSSLTKLADFFRSFGQVKKDDPSARDKAGEEEEKTAE